MTTDINIPIAWEILKGLLFLFLPWIGSVVRDMRTEQRKTNDALRDLKHIVVGVDGGNGLRSKVNDHDEQLGTMADRFVAMDAVEALEKASYEGEERRHSGQRRLRDMIREELEQADKNTERRKS